MTKRVVTLVAAAGAVVTAAIVATFLLASLGAPASAVLSTGTMAPMETETVTETMTSGESSSSHGLTPFAGSPAAIPGKIQAEDYDKGGQGVAWFDRTPGNQGGAYREDDVDLENGGSGHVVAFVKSSEWLTYSVEIAEAGTYAATFRASSPWTDREIWVWVDGILKAKVTVPQTTSFEVYKDTTASVALPAGTHVIRLEFYRDAQNLDSMTFEKTAGTGGGGASSTPTATVTQNATPGSGSGGSSGGGPGTTPTAKPGQGSGSDQAKTDAARMVDEGRQIFRYDTFGDEAFWTDALQLNKAIEGVDPKTALSVGLKVDMDALPQPLVNQIKQGKVNLSDPGTTLALLKLDAVVGVKGNVSADGKLQSLGITCGLCHSTVDDAFAPGIGHRLDGWPNRDLNVGAIINLSPNVQPLETRLGVDEKTVRTVLASWGPGKFDAELLHDGIAFNPEQVSNGVVTGTDVSGATLLPAAFGLAGVNLHTYTGWGSVPYWNAFVAVTEMQGKGRFYDPRLNDPVKFPLDAKFGTWNITPASPDDDLVTSKLPALHFYQLSLVAPTPPAGSFDVAAAARGDELFNGKADCGRCHSEPLFTEPGWNLHTADDIGIDSFQANRSPDGMYRTTPLKGIFAHEKGGFFHDGRFKDLAAVVDHYNTHFKLGLSDQEKSDVVEYVKSL